MIGKKVLILMHGEYPGERDTSQLADFCLGNKMKVFILSRFLGDQSLQTAFNDKINCYFFTKKRNTLNSIIAYPIFFNPFWFFKIIKIIKKKKIDLIIVRETQLGLHSVLLGFLFNIPIILDTREPMPIYFSYKFKSFFLKNFKFYYLYLFYERAILKHFDGYFFSSIELKNWYVKKYNLINIKNEIIYNIPDKYFIDYSKQIIKKKYKKKYDLVFAGYYDSNRGLEDIILALKILKTEKFNIKFKIITDKKGIFILKKIVNQNNLKNQITITKLLSPKKLIKELSKSKIGVCNYDINDHTNLTIPGKIFEYMLLQLPIISSSRKTVVDIIKKHKSGLVFKKNNKKNIADTILSLLKNKKKYSYLSKNSLYAMNKEYSYLNQKQKFKKLIIKVLNEKKNNY